jgi:hypothetical protein
MRQIHHPVRHPRQAATRAGCCSGSRHADTAALHKASKIIIVTLLKTDLNVPGRTLAESPASASARRAVHIDVDTGQA